MDRKRVWTAFTARVEQRSPDRQASIERRRRLAASGPLPPVMAARFTVSELAVLRIVGDEVLQLSCILKAAAGRDGTMSADMTGELLLTWY
jgi:hypothetical protein